MCDAVALNVRRGAHDEANTVNSLFRIGIKSSSTRSCANIKSGYVGADNHPPFLLLLKLL